MQHLLQANIPFDEFSRVYSEVKKNKAMLPELYKSLGRQGKLNLLYLTVWNLMPAKFLCKPLFQWLDQQMLPEEITDWFGFDNDMNLSSFSYGKQEEFSAVSYALSNMFAARFPGPTDWYDSLCNLVRQTLDAHFTPIFAKSGAPSHVCAHIFLWHYNFHDSLLEEHLLAAIRQEYNPDSLMDVLNHFSWGREGFYCQLGALKEQLCAQQDLLPHLYQWVNPNGKRVLLGMMVYALCPVWGEIYFFPIVNLLTPTELPDAVPDWSCLGKRVSVANRYSLTRMPLDTLEFAMSLAFELVTQLPDFFRREVLSLAKLFECYWEKTVAEANVSSAKAAKKLFQLHLLGQLDCASLSQAFVKAKHRSRSASPRRLTRN